MSQSNDRVNTGFFLGALGALAAITLGPWIYGAAVTPGSFQFQGNTVLSPADPNVYYSYIEQARAGAIMMRDAFTSEPHAATLWQPVWLVLGWLANLLRVSTPTIYTIGRVISMVVFSLTLWWAIRWFWDDQVTRRTALVLALGASGFGGIVAVVFGLDLNNIIALPPDLWVTEMVPILSSWATPHFLLITSGLLYVMVAIERSRLERSWSRFWLIGPVVLLTLSIHPYHLMTLGATWITLTIWHWRRAKKFPWEYGARWGAVVAMSLPAMAYYAAGLVADPIVQGRATQNINSTPSAWFVMIGLGILPVLAGLGGRRIWKEKTKHGWLVAWALVQALIIFLPLTGQRRLMQAMVVPYALLAAPVIAAGWRRWAVTGLRRAAFIGLAAVGLAGSTVTAAGVIGNDYAQERSGRNHWEYFLSPEYQELFRFIRQEVPPDRAIMATPWDGNLIAGQTGKTIVAGHPVETLNYAAKSAAVKRFFSRAGQNEQRDTLRRYRACYVLNGPRERAFGGAWNPSDWPAARVAWAGPTMTLSEITDCRSGE